MSHSDQLGVSAEAVLEALERIAASPRFAGSGRSIRFLRFVVKRTLDGKQDEVKEAVLGIEVFDRPAAFDSRLDSVVRVEAGRLRAKLRDYYAGPGKHDDVVIALPKGGYVPEFRLRADESGEEARSRAVLRWRLGVGLGAVLVLAGAVFLWTRSRPRPAWPETSTVAVLPFENLTGDSARDYFCEGLSEEVTTALAKVENLRVVARASSNQFRGKAQDIAMVGRKLKVRYLLSGALRGDATALRISAQLIDTNTGYHAWSESYARSVADSLTIQDDIAREVAAALRKRFSPNSNLANLVRSVSADARELYWRGRSVRQQRTPGAMEQSSTLFRQAIELAPLYAAAHSALAETYTTMAFQLAGLEPRRGLIEKARAEARRAIELDPALADAYGTLGALAFFYDWDWRAAEDAFRKALQYNPSYARLHGWYALGLMSRGRFDAAIDHMQTAVHLDPLSYAVTNDLGVSYYVARRWADCVHQASNSISADPSLASAHALLGCCYGAEGRYGRAIEEFQASLKRSNSRPSALLGRMGHAQAKLGRAPEARKLAAELREQLKSGEGAWVHMAILQTGLQERREALDSLEEAFRQRETDLNFIRVEPLFDPLRDEPRFQALERKIGLIE